MTVDGETFARGSYTERYMPIFLKGGKAIFFAHIPKTGGSTIEWKFTKSEYDVSYLDMEAAGLNRFRLCSPQHMDASQYTRILDLSRFEFMFAVVREPISRLKSELGMRLQTGFQNRIEQNDQWVLDGFKRYQTDGYVYDNHLRPQSEFIVPGFEVFRLEDGLNTIFSSLQSKHGVSLVAGDAQLRSRKEKSGFASADIELSDDVISRVKDFYVADYERYYPHLL